MEILQQDWAAKWAVYSPNKMALREYETRRTLTYAELNRLGNRLAHHLDAHFGIKKGDRIAVLAENCLEYLLLFAAAQKTGCILVPFNYRLASAEINFLLENAQPSIVIWEKKFEPVIKSAPSLGAVPIQWPMEDLAEFCSKDSSSEDDALFEPRPLHGDDPIFILYTSGTTGFPKGALYTHKMLFWNSINTALSLIINTDSRTIDCMPAFHTGGWNVLTTPLLHHGGFTCLLKKFDPVVVLKLLQEEQATVFMGVPTMLKMMAEQPEFETADFSHLHYIIVGGEPMPIPLIEKYHGKNVPIRQGYGMTEVGPNLTSLHQQDAIRKRGSIGRPNFYVDIKITDESGETVSPNQAGELLLRGPMVTPGYWKNETATAKAISGGWFHTGDMVRQDEEGYLYVVDRIKNMFISGGENVYPAEVERILLSHPDVSEAAVIGAPDPKWGEVGKAFVVPKSGKKPEREELLAYCLKYLAKFKVPKTVVITPTLPKTDTGKIDRQALKKITTKNEKG